VLLRLDVLDGLEGLCPVLCISSRVVHLLLETRVLVAAPLLPEALRGFVAAPLLPEGLQVLGLGVSS
jgi:hypothetical protein